LISYKEWTQVLLQTSDEETNAMFELLYKWLSEANEANLDMLEICQAMTLVGLVNVFHMCGSDTEQSTKFMEELKQVTFMLLDHYNEEEPTLH
jgi:hypothetical protein